MGDISKNFNRAEFACHCGCGFDTVDVDTLKMVQDIRDHYNKPVIINSGCRCLKHNKNVGSKDTSQHTKAKAVDIKIRDIAPEKIAFFVNEKHPDKYGIIIHDNFIHLDPRPDRLRKDVRT